MINPKFCEQLQWEIQLMFWNQYISSHLVNEHEPPHHHIQQPLQGLAFAIFLHTFFEGFILYALSFSHCCQMTLDFEWKNEWQHHIWVNKLHFDWLNAFLLKRKWQRNL